MEERDPRSLRTGKSILQTELEFLGDCRRLGASYLGYVDKKLKIVQLTKVDSEIQQEKEYYEEMIKELTKTKFQRVTNYENSGVWWQKPWLINIGLLLVISYCLAMIPYFFRVIAVPWK